MDFKRFCYASGDFSRGRPGFATGNGAASSTERFVENPAAHWAERSVSPTKRELDDFATRVSPLQPAGGLFSGLLPPPEALHGQEEETREARAHACKLLAELHAAQDDKAELEVIFYKITSIINRKCLTLHIEPSKQNKNRSG